MLWQAQWSVRTLRLVTGSTPIDPLDMCDSDMRDPVWHVVIILTWPQTNPMSDMLHVLCVVCVVTLTSHASILITIPDFKLARHKCQCFKFRGYFTNYCSNKLHSTNVKWSHFIIFQSGLQCYEWQLISQQTQEAIIDCGKNMFMSIIFYWQSFIFYKYHRK